jgi:hypothetical protein
LNFPPPCSVSGMTNGVDVTHRQIAMLRETVPPV